MWYATVSLILRQYSLLFFYSDKLANQPVMNNCLYFCCTVVHPEECMSPKMASLLWWRHESKWAHWNTEHIKIRTTQVWFHKRSKNKIAAILFDFPMVWTIRKPNFFGASLDHFLYKHNFYFSIKWSRLSKSLVF